jgi:hypothetical protein
VVVGIPVVAGLEGQSDRLTGRLQVDDDRRQTGRSPLRCPPAWCRSTDEDAGTDVDGEQTRNEGALSTVALAVEVESTLTGEEQASRSRPCPTRIRSVDDDAAHEVAAGPFALVDVGQQLGHAEEPKMSAATVSAAAASRLGATWL